ncbi:hypothetical protein ACWEBX_38850, partial [Streptomyces sp. NPDC005070]
RGPSPGSARRAGPPTPGSRPPGRATYGRTPGPTDIPVNHSPTFAPVIQPTLDTGVSALAVAALAWLG